MSIERLSRTTLGALIVLTLFTGSSRAQNRETAPDVQKLLEKIDRLEHRVQELEAGQTALPSERLETRINAVADGTDLAPDNAYSVFWKNTHNFQTDDKNFGLKFGGRVDLHFIWNTQDKSTENAFGHFDDAVNFRRVRIYVAGHIYKNAIFKIQLDFEDGIADFKDVYLGLKNILGGGTVRAGQFKIPFSLEELTSSKYISFVERAAPNVFAFSRQSGLMYHNTFGEEDRIWFGVSVFRTVDAFGDVTDDGSYGAAARLTGLPIYEDGGRTLLHVGVAIGYQNPVDDVLRFRQRPETSIGPRLVDTGTFSAEDDVRVVAEAALVLGSFSAQAEYFHVFVNSNATGDPDFWGGYVYLTYFLTGEHRKYKKSAGAFSRVSPAANFHDGGDGSGAWEVGVRYSYVDLNDEGINGGELGSLTAGVTWYVNPNMKLMINYTWGNVDDIPGLSGDTSAHIVTLRFLIDF